MTNVELYINQKLCDIQNPENLGVRLNRVLINPAELATKDAQYSYSITIPSTPVNDAIFSYANVEEVKNKFNHNHTAQLYVNGLRVFDGRFKLNEIDVDGSYKGNLVVPARKTVKDIFGDKKMNEAGEWILNLKDGDRIKDMVETLNYFNSSKDTPQCIFPLVLYGLLPKVPEKTVNKDDIYTSKNQWDKYVRLGVEDFPPSINCMQAIKQIFENTKDEKGNPRYTISGSAFDDPRLTSLYMSYRNPVGYQQEWNWGHLGKMHIAGTWSNMKSSTTKPSFEKNFIYNDSTDRRVYVVDMFNSTMTDYTKLLDNGTNVLYRQAATENDEVLHKTHITIPQSGLYKIEFSASIDVNSDKNKLWATSGHLILSGTSTRSSNSLNDRSFEIKVLRDYGEGSFDLENLKLDAAFFKNNLPQDLPFDKHNRKEYYFPTLKSGGVHFVDPSQNSRLVCGLKWGKRSEDSYYYDPIDEGHMSVLAITNGWSWDNKYDQKHKVYSAIKSKGYKKWAIKEKDKDSAENDIWGWSDTDKYAIDIDGVEKNSISMNNPYSGSGKLYQVVWLNKGEHLTIASTCDEGVYHNPFSESPGPYYRGYGWIRHSWSFDLKITPFKKDAEWITVDNSGTGIHTMNWNDVSDFKEDEINLMRFLPSDVKIDEWLDNFCKVFNLQLLQPEANKFELNVKTNQASALTSSVIDFDSKTSIAQRTNQPLGLPSAFDLGFKINEEEEGFVLSKKNRPQSIGETGGGRYETGNIDGQVLAQSSNFSYCWYKKITHLGDPVNVVDNGDCSWIDPHTGESLCTNEDSEIITHIEYPQTELNVPVITHNEIWKDGVKNYTEMQRKQYTNYAQRFWYKTDTVQLNAIWKNEYLPQEMQSADKLRQLVLPQLSNKYEGDKILELDYHRKPNSILDSYFRLIVTDDSNYTYVDCYLTPYEYEQLDGTRLVKLNCDLYYIAAIEGYDPLGRNKAKLKLIRKV